MKRELKRILKTKDFRSHHLPLSVNVRQEQGYVSEVEGEA